jgi:hypothetical protein
MDLLYLGVRLMASCHERDDETAGVVEGEKLLKQLNICQPVKNAVPYS